MSCIPNVCVGGDGGGGGVETAKLSYTLELGISLGP